MTKLFPATTGGHPTQLDRYRRSERIDELTVVARGSCRERRI